MQLKWLWISIHHFQCPICGHLSWYRKSPICETCVETLVTQFCFVKRQAHQIPHNYLLKWRPGESDLISFVIRSLKNQPSTRIYTLAAKILLKNWIAQRGFQKAILIPVPSQGRGTFHARNFAQAIADLSGFDIWDGLELKTKNQQKALGITERKKRQIGLRRNFTLSELSNKRLILIDDVLTTGGTAEAVKKALKPLRICQVWTLAYRERKELTLG